jgi:predicted Zn finger-like uncharacterized protein
MKITCTACSARYAIDDTKLAGRAVKIRCKRCGAGMVARGATRDFFVLVGETSEGPLSQPEMAARIASGDVDSESLVWHEDLSDWTPLARIPELAVLCSASRGALFEPGPDSRRFDAGPAVGARDESSVLFSLSNLQGLASGGAPKTTVAASGEGSGLIDIRQLSALAAPVERTSVPTLDLVLSVPALSSSPLSAPVIAMPLRGDARPSRLRAAVGLLGAAAALVLLGVGFVASGRANTVEARDAGEVPLTAGPIAAGPIVAGPVAAETITAEPIAADPIAVGTTIAPTPLAAPEAAPSRLALPARSRNRVARTEIAPAVPPAVTPAPVTPASTTRPSMEELVRRATDSEARSEDAPSAPAERLPETPSPVEVRRAMEALTPAMRACAGGTHGRALVSVVVSGATGASRSARVGGDFSETPAAACIERVARGVALSPFARPTFTVSFPFAL